MIVGGARVRFDSNPSPKNMFQAIVGYPFGVGSRVKLPGDKFGVGPIWRARRKRWEAVCGLGAEPGPQSAGGDRLAAAVSRRPAKPARAEPQGQPPGPQGAVGSPVRSPRVRFPKPKARVRICFFGVEVVMDPSATF